MSSISIPEAVAPHQATAGAIYVTVDIGHGQHVMVLEQDAAEVTARVAFERAGAEALERSRLAARRAVRT